MSLHTFEIKWRAKDTGIRITRLLTSTVESADVWIKENEPKLHYVIKITQEPERTHYCDKCGSKLSANFIQEKLMENCTPEMLNVIKETVETVGFIIVCVTGLIVLSKL